MVGAVARGGKVIAVPVSDASKKTLEGFAKQYVLPESTVYTDEWGGYSDFENKGYNHRRVTHSAGAYVIGSTHTQTIEGFWSLVKRGIGGVYHSVSKKYLQSYLDEYSYRYNRRNSEVPMFISLLDEVAEPVKSLPPAAQGL